VDGSRPKARPLGTTSGRSIELPLQGPRQRGPRRIRLIASGLPHTPRAVISASFRSVSKSSIWAVGADQTGGCHEGAPSPHPRAGRGRRHGRDVAAQRLDLVKELRGMRASKTPRSSLSAEVSAPLGSKRRRDGGRCSAGRLGLTWVELSSWVGLWLRRVVPSPPGSLFAVQRGLSLAYPWALRALPNRR